MPETKEENLHKELDLIQAIITRLAQNAFYMKGWSITLVSIVLALSKDDLLTTAQPTWLLSLILVVWLCFWYLDAYFCRRNACTACSTLTSLIIRMTRFGCATTSMQVPTRRERDQFGKRCALPLCGCFMVFQLCYSQVYYFTFY